MRLPSSLGSSQQPASTASSSLVSTFASAAAALVLTASTTLAGPQPALALDGAAIGTCLIGKCPLPLARCVGDPTCLANLACIQTCTGKPDEGDCQVKCGDEVR